MATYHLSLSTISRARGQSAVAAAAYRAGERLRCEREGLTKHPRRNPADVQHKELIGWAGTRAGLWSAAELAEKRKNAVVARELLVALPKELSHASHIELVSGMGYWLAATFNVAVDIAIHRPRSGAGANENHHAHLLFTSRAVDGSEFREKTRILDNRETGAAEITRMRGEWERRLNRALQMLRTRLRVSAKKQLVPQPKLTVREAAALRRLSKHQSVSTTLKQLLAGAGNASNMLEVAIPLRRAQPTIK